MLDTVKINHVQHISFTQSRLTDAVSVILRELLSYEHPSKAAALFLSVHFSAWWFRAAVRILRISMARVMGPTPPGTGVM